MYDIIKIYYKTGVIFVSVDVLQEKIRKTKNPSVLELALPVAELPPQFARNAEGYASFSRELLADHIKTCVARDIRDGKEETVDELVATLQKLMK